MPLSGYYPRNFVTGAAIGRGRTRPADIRKLRRSLDELDYLRSPQKATPSYTSAVADAVESFQRDYSLKPDGAIDPDGPTEQTSTSPSPPNGRAEARR